MSILEGFSSNENETAIAPSTTSVEDILSQVKASGMTQQLWSDLCSAVAGRVNGNAIDYRNDLASHLATIGFSYTGLFTHIGKNGAFYRNAWRGTYFYANVVAGDYKCAAFLAY